MAKYTPEDVKRIAERLRMAKDRSRPAHFLIGAGCSLTAEIPSASEIVKIIHENYPAQCGDLTDANRDSYGACMGLLSINERRDLIKPLLGKAKVNWGHIALAQMIGSGFVGRVLSVNFDLVLENACGLLGLQPAVYDFGIAPANDAALIVSPAICHLHGQSYGLILLNTEEETQEHRNKLRPVLVDSLRTAPLLVIGYSGSADGVFQTLLDDFEGRESLYWMGYSSEPSRHIQPLFEKRLARFLGEADFDRFMIDLAQTLGCWPPRLFSDPLAQLSHELTPLVSYPVGEADSKIDILSDLRSKLADWRRRFSEGEKKSFAAVRSAFMKGDYTAAGRAVDALVPRELASLSPEEREIAFWSVLERGVLLRQEAKSANDEEATWRLLGEAGEKYRQALAIMPNRYEALNNWGLILFDQGRMETGEEAARFFGESDEKYRHALLVKPDGFEALGNLGLLLMQQGRGASGENQARLFAEATQKYHQALAIKPGDHEALNNWGTLLMEQAQRASGDTAARLLGEAGEKYRQALVIKPDKHEAISNWGLLLVEQAKRASGEDATRLFGEAGEKYRQALAIKPDSYEALHKWGFLLVEQARRASGEDAARLFGEAGEKYRQALAIKPDYYEALSSWGNLLSLQAQRASGDEMARLYSEAELKLSSALKVKPKATYNLACLAALRGQEENCRDYLNHAKTHATLPNKEHLRTDTDLDVVRNEPWFQELLASLDG